MVQPKQILANQRREQAVGDQWEAGLRGLWCAPTALALGILISVHPSVVPSSERLVTVTRVRRHRRHRRDADHTSGAGDHGGLMAGGGGRERAEQRHVTSDRCVTGAEGVMCPVS